MGSYTRSAEERRLELAYALGNGIDPIEHFEALTRGEGWVDGEADE